jgi:cysteine desulfurase/selenocysteine lyase
MSIEHIRKQFPILGSKVYGKPLVYLDNAATAQRPISVQETWNRLVQEENANIHRAVHYLSSRATDAFEDTRECVRRFIKAKSREEIVFTSGSTAAINLVAFSFGEAYVREGDYIAVTVAEHHSNLVPWQMLCQRKGAHLCIIDVGSDGSIDPVSLEEQLDKSPRILAITHISNVLGVVNPIKAIVQQAHSASVPVLVDGSQGIVHVPVDVQDLDCDFYVFSGHKLYAATGTGILYGKQKWLEAMPPYMGGGEMINSVSFIHTTYAPLPHKFEAGTQDFNAIPTLVPAIDFTTEARWDPQVKKEQDAIFDLIYKELTSNPDIRLFGDCSIPKIKVPLFSFAVVGAHHEDLALILDKMGIAVRSGQMCAEPLMDHLGVTGLLRVSFAPYNTFEEAEYFIGALKKAIKMLV